MLTKKLHFMINGDPFLLEAMKKHLEQLGLRGAKNDSTTQALGVNGNIGGAQLWYTRDTAGSFSNKVYTLPQDYNTVIEEVKAFLAPALPVFKVGDYVYWVESYNTNSEWFLKGDIGRVEAVSPLSSSKNRTTYILYSSRYKSRGGFTPGDHVVGNKLRLATEEEIKEYLIAEAEKIGMKIGETAQFTLTPDNTMWALKIGGFIYEKGDDSLSITANLGDFLAKINSDGQVQEDFTDRHCASILGKVYEKGVWRATNSKPYIKSAVPILTFGGNRVILGLLGIDNLRIVINGEFSTYYQVKAFYEAFKTVYGFKFGAYSLATTKPLNKDKQLKFGCTTGTFGEVEAIVQACEHLLLKAQ